DNIDCIIAIFASQGVVTADEPAKAIVDVTKKYDKPALAFWMGGSSIVEALEIFRENKIPVYPSPKRVPRAAYFLSRYGIYKENSV
ncbi:MAG: acetyl-CoA synthetase, partial [Promethearchaeota archaeon]